MKGLNKFANIVAKYTTYAAAALIFVMVASLIIQVVARFGFQRGIRWADEVSRYSVIWSVMLISNVAIKNRELITVDFLDKYWPERFIRWRNAVYNLIFVVLLVVLTWQGYLQAYNNINFITTGLRISRAIPYAAIPVGAVLMLFQFFVQLMNNIFPQEEV